MKKLAWKLALMLALVMAVAAIQEVGSQTNRRLIPLDFDGATADTTAVGMADSTAVLETGRFERLYLHLKASTHCRVAIQIRKHGVSDTANAPFLADTFNTAVWPWRTFSTANADSVVLRHTQNPTAVAAGSHELVVEFPALAAGNKWGAARGLVIPLRGADGEWYWAQHTSIRVRVLSGSGVVTWSGALEGVSW